MEETTIKLIEEELARHGLPGAGYELVREKCGVILVRVRAEGAARILKAFEDEPSRREIANYRILRALGVPTIGVFGCTERSILMEDIEASDTLRLGREEDLHDPDVIRAIARWYRLLHLRGEEYVKEHGSGMYDEWDLFTPEGIDLLSRRLGDDFGDALDGVKKRYGSLRARMDAAPKTLCYNDFYYTNLAVAKDKSAALMFDYNLLGKGCYINDVQNVVYWFTDAERELFMSEYGEADSGLTELQREISPVITLISAVRRGIFPDWAEEAGRELNFAFAERE